MGRTGMSLIRLVEEKACQKKAKEEERRRLIPYLPKDCVANILIRLPHDSLQRSMAVCKAWRDVTKSLNFISSYLHHAESILIFQTPIQRERFPSIYTAPVLAEKPNTFSVEVKLSESQNVSIFRQCINPRSKFCIKYLEFADGKGEIRDYNLSCLGSVMATCNGLLLLENKMKKGGLIILNPITRKLIALPVGTLYPNHHESYGFALNEISGDYKIVHLFRDELEYVNCEILDLKTRVWRGVNGLASGHLDWLGYKPVFAIKSLHWVPQIDHSDHIVSIEVDSERFHMVPLPKSCRTHDRIVEIHGSLGFVTHVDINHIDVWLLKGISRDNRWTLMHSITVTSTFDMVAVCSLKVRGDLVFEREEDYSLFLYDFKLEDMQKMDVADGFLGRLGSPLAHVNSFISW